MPPKPAENGPFLSFPYYVCPEPVLVKQCILYINGSKSAVFRTDIPPVSPAEQKKTDTSPFWSTFSQTCPEHVLANRSFVSFLFLMRANGSQRLVVIRSRTSTRPSPYQSSGRCYQDRQKLAPPVRALPSPPLSQAQSLTRVKASRCPHRYRQPHSCRSPRGRLVAASLSRQQQAAHRSARTTRGRRCCANQKGVVLSQCALRLSRACLGQIIVLSSK